MVDEPSRSSQYIPTAELELYANSIQGPEQVAEFLSKIVPLIEGMPGADIRTMTTEERSFPGNTHEARSFDVMARHESSYDILGTSFDHGEQYPQSSPGDETCCLAVYAGMPGRTEGRMLGTSMDVDETSQLRFNLETSYDYDHRGAVDLGC